MTEAAVSASVTVEIKHRWTGAVLFSASVSASLSYGRRIGAAVKLAFEARADLTRADLTGADLTDADLTRADLTGAVLTGADLTDADLTDADLTRADLTDAVLTGADLTRADLTDAVLTRAVLTDAYGLILPTPEEAAQRIKAIAQAVLVDGAGFEMRDVHTCNTTHCIAGWAVHNEGPVGYTLEKAVGWNMAGLMLLGVEAHSHFHDTNEQAKAWLQSKLEAVS
jgi:hypothetical protein